MKLTRLNELLRSEFPDLPYFRSEVDRAGQNLHWLRKHLSGKASEELKNLLALDIGHLTQ
jgi:hypothetical protein